MNTPTANPTHSQSDLTNTLSRTPAATDSAASGGVYCCILQMRVDLGAHVFMSKMSLKKSPNPAAVRTLLVRAGRWGLRWPPAALALATSRWLLLALVLLLL